MPADESSEARDAAFEGFDRWIDVGESAYSDDQSSELKRADATVDSERPAVAPDGSQPGPEGGVDPASSKNNISESGGPSGRDQSINESFVDAKAPSSDGEQVAEQLPRGAPSGETGAARYNLRARKDGFRYALLAKALAAEGEEPVTVEQALASRDARR